MKFHCRGKYYSNTYLADFASSVSLKSVPSLPLATSTPMLSRSSKDLYLEKINVDFDLRKFYQLQILPNMYVKKNCQLIIIKLISQYFFNAMNFGPLSFVDGNHQPMLINLFHHKGWHISSWKPFLLRLGHILLMNGLFLKNNGQFCLKTTKTFNF